MKICRKCQSAENPKRDYCQVCRKATSMQKIWKAFRNTFH